MNSKSGLNDLYHKRKYAAKRRGQHWDLTQRQFKALVDGDCTYCGAPPQRLHKTSRQGQATYFYTYNGVDRVDNSIGYTAANCVSCCWMCNRAKAGETVETFEAWIVRAYNTLSRG